MFGDIPIDLDNMDDLVDSLLLAHKCDERKGTISGRQYQYSYEYYGASFDVFNAKIIYNYRGTFYVDGDDGMIFPFDGNFQISERVPYWLN
jgi:hypothetical protein